MKEKNRLFSDICIFIVGTVLTKIIQFVLLPLYTSYMTAESYGTAELINNLAEFFLPLSSLCIYDAVLRFTIEKKRREVVISSSMCVISISLFISMPLSIIVGYYCDSIYILLFEFILYAYSIQRLFACYVRGKGYSKVYAFSGGVNALFVAGFSVFFLVYLGLGVEGYLLAIALGYLFSAIYLLIVGKIYDDIKWTSSSKMMVKEMILFSIPLVPYNIMYFFLTLAGRYILLWVHGEGMVGIYSAAIKLSALLNILQQAVTTALQLNVSQEFARNNKEIYYSYVFDLFYSGYWVLASWMMCICPLLAKILLKNEFYSARIYLPVIMLSAILNCISAMYGTMFQTYKKTGKNVPIVFVGMIINIVCCIWLVPRYEIWGVCMASIIAYTSQIFLKIVCINSFCKISYELKKMITFPILIIFQVILLLIDNSTNMYMVVFVFSILETIYFIFTYYKKVNEIKKMLL